MDRGSSKHSPRVDDELAEEVQHPGEDTEAVGLEPEEEDDFSRFGRYLGRVFPADRDALLESARGFEAPDDVIDRLGTLPPGTTYTTAAEVWEETS